MTLISGETTGSMSASVQRLLESAFGPQSLVCFVVHLPGVNLGPMLLIPQQLPWQQIASVCVTTSLLKNLALVLTQVCSTCDSRALS